MIIVDDANKLAAKGDDFAKLCAAEWRYPVEIVFATPEGKLISKMNSEQDFPHVHANVAVPNGEHPGTQSPGQAHKDVFLQRLNELLEKK